MDLQNICTRREKKVVSKRNNRLSEETASGADVGKPGIEEHLTFGMFRDDNKCWHISSGILRLLEGRELSSEDYMPTMQSKNNIY